MKATPSVLPINGTRKGETGSPAIVHHKTFSHYFPQLSQPQPSRFPVCRCSPTLDFWLVWTRVRRIWVTLNWPLCLVNTPPRPHPAPNTHKSICFPCSRIRNELLPPVSFSLGCNNPDLANTCLLKILDPLVFASFLLWIKSYGYRSKQYWKESAGGCRERAADTNAQRRQAGAIRTWSEWDVRANCLQALIPSARFCPTFDTVKDTYNLS